jgi:hypothetical protein
MNDAFWLDVTKALIGTVAGALLGVGAGFLTWRIQQRRIDLSTGNIAVLTLAQYVAAIKLVSRAVNEEKERVRQVYPQQRLPLWATVRAPSVALNRNLDFDLKQLAFLSDKPRLLEGLMLCERLYFDLVQSIDEYRKVHLQIQRATFEGGFRADQAVQLGEIEAKVGPDLTNQAETLMTSIIENSSKSETEIRAIGGQLSAELKSRLGRSLILRRKLKVVEFAAPSEPTVDGGR